MAVKSPLTKFRTQAFFKLALPTRHTIFPSIILKVVPIIDSEALKKQIKNYNI